MFHKQQSQLPGLAAAWHYYNYANQSAADADYEQPVTLPFTLSEGRSFASPAAKKLAEEKNSLKGTGADGCIIKADVEDYLGMLIVTACRILRSKQTIPHFYLRASTLVLTEQLNQAQEAAKRKKL
ncbi:hypothetical protein R1sor_021521 [Riccia sorocarpa]|uniref:Peripheral subunit-binding (PSBD) domain-containing protein n=1 Tax=Riccia sorocarpa TaxID=122646 RepID=A0ABD3GKM3_9MARC